MISTNNCILMATQALKSHNAFLIATQGEHDVRETRLGKNYLKPE